LNKSRLTILICLLLAALTFAAFWRVLGCDFVNFDDDVYVTANRWVRAGLTGASVRWALTAAYESTWQPMVWLSYMLDREIYGLNATGFHLTNLLLHLANVLLLFLILRRMTGSLWKSAFVAALFSVHPLRVESVAWVAERKDVLSTLFWMLSMGAYVLYNEKPGWKRHVPVFLFMALGLMAKPMLVTLPLALLLLDYWPLGRLSKDSTPVRLILEKGPLVCLSAASVVAASTAHVKCGGLGMMEQLPTGVRVANAAYSYVVYLVKTVWPSKLAVFYPHPFDTIPGWQVAGSAVLLICLTVLTLRAARTRPYLAVGWLWYLGTLLPMSGLVQTGMHGRADRFTYIPLIGVFVMLAWGIAECCERRREIGARTLAVPAVAVIIACAIGTWHQTGYWKDGVALFTRAVAVTERNALAEANLGIAYANQKKYRQAIEHSEAAIRIQPDMRAYNNIGVALEGLGRHDEAVSYYEKALQLSPNYAPSHHNLGHALFRQRRYDDAVKHFRQAIVRAPNNADSHYYLALSLVNLGEADEAERHYREVLAIDDRYYRAHYNLGVILAERGEYDEAAREFEAAIRIKPTYARAHHNLGGALDSLDRTDEAMEAYREAIRLKPDLGEAHNNLAIDLYAVGRYDEAWREMELARKHGVTPHPEFVKALAEKVGGR